MQFSDISILHLPKEMRYLQLDLTSYIQKRFRPRLLGFNSLPKVKVVSQQDNLKLTGSDTSLINFQTRTIFINVRTDFTPARQWEEALGDTVHENLHDVWDLFPKDEKWDQAKRTLLNIFMDGRNEQYATYKDQFSGELLTKMRIHAYDDLQAIPRKQWFAGDELWASSYLSLKIHTGLMAKYPELIKEFQSGQLSPKSFWRKVKRALKLRKPPAKLRWEEAWEIICRFWLSDNIYQKSKLVDEFRALYPVPQKEDPPNSPENRNNHQGVPVPAGGQGEGDEQSGQAGGDKSDDGSTRPEPNNIPAPPKPTSSEDVEDQVSEEKQGSSQCGSSRPTGDGMIFPADGRDLETRAKALSQYLKREVSILMAPKKKDITISSNRIRMTKVLRNPNTRDPWKKKKETELDTNVVSLKFIGDTSGSMDSNGKLEAMKLALGVFHEVCSGINGVEHEIYTSVGFNQLYEKNTSRARGFNLLAGLDTFGGDDFDKTLPKLFAKIRGGKEIVFMFTDGQPGSISLLSQIIADARKRGTIVFGVGLNIDSESDRKGMQTLFGEDRLLATITQQNGEDFVQKMTTALRNLVRRRLLQ